MENYIDLLPCITWKWLKMNGRTEDISPASHGAEGINIPEGWQVSDDRTAYGSDIDPRSNKQIEKALFDGKIVTGIGPYMDHTAKVNGIPVVRMTAGEAPLIIENRYAQDDHIMTCIEVTVPDGMHTTVIEKFLSEDDTTAEAAFQTKFIIGKNASVDFVQVQKLGRGVKLFNDIGSKIDKDGRLDQVYVLISGGKTFFGSRTALNGDKSACSLDMAYIVKGEEELDTNIAAFQTGRKTDTQITVNGTLKDKAKKLMRATIDFKKGSSGSTGKETEDVLMMNEGVINRTVPLILCTEEDVEGIHGATLGRPSEEIVTYMMSRGLDKASIYDIMEKARLDACTAKIADEATREETARYLHPEEE
ncbi:MAG: SufD family Fe-S cluster assembly protein [Oscillospiraceae bacterium]|nr:SufD family Fe-S cluster assembly protein [Oscillospiraceae bacterium]